MDRPYRKASLLEMLKSELKRIVKFCYHIYYKCIMTNNDYHDTINKLFTMKLVKKVIYNLHIYLNYINKQLLSEMLNKSLFYYHFLIGIVPAWVCLGGCSSNTLLTPMPTSDRYFLRGRGCWFFLRRVCS